MIDRWTSNLSAARSLPRASRRDAVQKTPSLQRPALREPEAPRHPLGEPALFYDPPYDDPLHDALAGHLVKYLDPSCTLQHRAVVLTPDDCFRVDFLIEQEEGPLGTRRVGIMCGNRSDGYGDTLDTPALRDALVVGAGAVDVLYRFREEDLTHRLYDVLHLMAKWDPALFKQGGREKLRRLASDEARHHAVGADDAEVRLRYAPALVDVRPGGIPERPTAPDELIVRRLSQLHPAGWIKAYDRALARYDRRPDRRDEPWRKSA